MSVGAIITGGVVSDMVAILDDVTDEVGRSYPAPDVIDAKM